LQVVVDVEAVGWTEEDFVAEVVATEVEEAFREEGWIEVDEDVEVQ
jgi:hypothetical protein